MTFVRRLIDAPDGSTGIEYGLLILVIALALFGVLGTIGQQVVDFLISVNKGFGS